MKVVFVLVAIAIFTVTSIVGQRRPPNASTRNGPVNPESSEAAARSLTQLRHLETKQTRINEDDPKSKLYEFYRRIAPNEAGVLSVSSNVQSAFATFLSQPKTGIVKLNANKKCGVDPEVVSADRSCENFQIPGGGTSFSFRYDSYRIPRLSDLILKKNVLLTDGAAQQGLMIDLGEIPIDRLTIDSPELKFLRNFKPASTRQEFEFVSKELETGMRNESGLYRIAFFANPGRTFALRSIAFQGSLVRRNSDGVYDEFKMDKRHDVLILFRVVEIDKNGDVTIVWKELERKDSPRLPA